MLALTRARPAAAGGAASPAAARHRGAALRAAAAPAHVDVAVVGGGPAGLAAAAALRAVLPRGAEVRVFERTARTARGEAVLVGVNGLKALAAIDPALTDGLLRKAIRLEGSDRYDKDTGEWMEFMPMRNDAFKQKYGFSNALLGWSDITGALAESLPPGCVVANCPVTGFRQEAGRPIELLAPAEGGDAQRVVATCEALIGADGWFSAIRQQALGDGPPAFKDVVVWRARIPKPDFLPAARTMWWVPRGGVMPGAVLAVLIPVPGGDAVWQCHCPIDLMRSKGLAFDSAVGEAASSHAANARDGGATAKERCLAAFAELPAAFRDVVAATPAESITEHGLYQRTAETIPDVWGRGMVTLAGDAAHTAYVDGTGLALSLEDAAVLGACVRDGGLTEAALRSYEAARVPRVREVFSLTGRHAEAMKAGVPQRQLLDERAELLYSVRFEPLAAPAAAPA
ncbi:Zeaxanthin epoxidase [Scenedesmus sp. PABB004]|nr:Zeaxanthin epoxidase [Scenedesmus sp. PABB004]